MMNGHVHTSLCVGTAAVLLLPAFAAGRMDNQDDEPREQSAAEAAQRGNQDEPSREQNDEAADGSAPSMVGTGDAPLIQAVETELSEAQGLEGASITVGVSDGTLLLSGERVEGALLRDPYVSGFDVDVDAVDGEVYLYGDVASYFAKFEAGDAAARVAGARDIHNDIDVGYRIPVAYTFYDWDPILSAISTANMSRN